MAGRAGQGLGMGLGTAKGMVKDPGPGLLQLDQRKAVVLRLFRLLLSGALLLLRRRRLTGRCRTLRRRRRGLRRTRGARRLLRRRLLGLVERSVVDAARRARNALA